MTALWFLACFVLQLSLAPFANQTWTGQLAWIWIGAMWGGWAACVWWSGGVRNPVLRGLFLSVVTVWHVYWMSRSRDLPPQRYLIMLGGYGFTQAVLFRLLRVPRWSTSLRHIERVDDQTGQFNIGEMLLITTGTAALITVARRYQPQVDVAYFYTGLLSIWLCFGLLATLCIHTLHAANQMRRRLLALSILVAITVSSILHASLETLFHPPLTLTEAIVPYYAVQSVFALLLITLGACGHVALSGRSAGPIEHDESMETDT